MINLEEQRCIAEIKLLAVLKAPQDGTNRFHNNVDTSELYGIEMYAGKKTK